MYTTITPLPLEVIAADHGDTYSKATELAQAMGRCPTIGTICSDASIYPADVIRRFHDRLSRETGRHGGYFTDPEAELVSRVYGTLERHRTANAKFTKEGYRDDLVSLMRKMDGHYKPRKKNQGGRRASFLARITDIQNGSLISDQIFSGALDYLALLPEAKAKKLGRELAMLKDKFLIMLNLAGVAAKSYGYFGAD